MYSGMECTLSKCAEDSTLEGRDAIDRLERWACANLIKFNKVKCKVLHLGWGNSKHKYNLAGEWIKISPVEKDLGVFIDKKFYMTHQCTLAAQKASYTLGCLKTAQPDPAETPWHIRGLVNHQPFEV
ncbi:rna-directed dna polymerase from mobile element jockey-like [Willisornis vidua]|uniref:Rna-directed dna polymerase from mobile element jockey-like n=1 Tax=Willisornis vidua TaxID=1566151 RepID=A0ABQ9D2C7_9PASS|nr:rna-directed dna polymerase from mobile element jockey-like [Willisornis vidua]